MPAGEIVRDYLFFELIETPTTKIGRSFGDAFTRKDKLWEEKILVFSIRGNELTCTKVTDVYKRSGDFRVRVGGSTEAVEFPKNTVFELILPETSYDENPPQISVHTVSKRGVFTRSQHNVKDEYPLLRLTISS